MLFSFIYRVLSLKKKEIWDNDLYIWINADITWHSIPTYVSIHDSSENKEK